MHDRVFEQLNNRLPARSGPRDEGASCLACGTRIGADEPTIKVRGSVVHLRCAVYRRGMGRRHAA